MTGSIACFNCGNDQLVHGYGRHKQAGAIVVIACQLCDYHVQSVLPSRQAEAQLFLLRRDGPEVIEMESAA